MLSELAPSIELLHVVPRGKRGEWELVLHSTLAPVCFGRFFNGPQTMWEEKTMGAMT